MILLIDNYDSFVHNLARYLEELGTETRVVRNDSISPAEIRELHPQAIVLSPGPCRPEDAGITLDVIRELGGHIPMLGVCLGHQAIGQALGANVQRAATPMHGRTSVIHHTGQGLFAGLPQPLRVMRYHSLLIEDVRPPLTVTARTDDAVVMAVQHDRWPLWGVQFHPESVLTECGHQLLGNFLRLSGVPYTDYRSSEYTPRPLDPNDFYRRDFDDEVSSVSSWQPGP